MRLANLIKSMSARGLMPGQQNDDVRKARIIHFEEIIDEVMNLKSDQWCARLPFPECLINLENKICMLVQERFDEAFPGLTKGDTLVHCTAFVGLEQGFKTLPLDMRFAVDKDGVVKSNWGWHTGNIFVRRTDGLDATEMDQKTALSFVTTCLSHLTFLNCRNVSLEKIEQASDRINQKRIRDNKKPLYSYYVATINGQRISRTSTPTGDRAHWRYHLCRGHFKQRKTGRFWWSQHARGDKDLGSIVKDYKVDSSVAV